MVGPFYITRSRTLWGCDFEIWPALTSAQLAAIQGYQGGTYGVYFKAKDDGDYSLFDSPQYLDFGTLNEAYREAYIEVVYSDAFNQMKVQPYKREVSYLDLIGTLYGARDLHSEPCLWVARVVAAFEGGPSLVQLGLLSDVDVDPDGVININNGVEPYEGAQPVVSGSELLGITPPCFNVSVVFLETLRDGNIAYRTGGTPIPAGKVAIHEMTHSGGPTAVSHDDSELNLMNTEPDDFNLASHFSTKVIDFLRNVNTW
jgi:hypothetical protein